MPSLTKNKKSLRDKLQATDAFSTEPTYSTSPSLPPGPAVMTGPSVSKNPYAPINASVNAPAKQLGASGSWGATDEQPDMSVTPEDEKTAAFLQESQSLEGPEKGKVRPEGVPEPQDFNSFLRKWRSVPNKLSDKDKQIFQDKLSELDKRMVQAEEDYKANKDKLAWAEVAEQLGHAMVQLFAAQDAAKNNWSINGIKFDKNDWQSKMDRALREYDSKKDTLYKQQGAVQRELERADSKSERAGTSEQRLLERDFFTTQARIQAEAKKSSKDAKSDDQKERMAREKARMYIANYEAAEDAANKLEKGEYEDDKEKQKLKDEITDSLRKNGHIGVSKDLSEGGQGAVEKKGGVFGFFQSDDYDKMKKYISANKKRGVQSVYQGYGVQVPKDVQEALLGQDQPATVPAEQPKQEGLAAKTAPAASGEVERAGPDGRIIIYDAETKKPLRYK